MTENPLKSNLPVPGSGSTREPGNRGSGQMGAANVAAEAMPEHRKARGRGVPGSCESCGRPWPCPPEAAHRRRLRASSAHLADQPIISGDWLPPDFLLGVADPTPPRSSSHDSIQMTVDTEPHRFGLAVAGVVIVAVVVFASFAAIWAVTR